MNINNYIPILKTKAGEFEAIVNLSSNTRNSITPFFDIPQIKEIRDTPADYYLCDIALNLVKKWGTSPFFIDIFDFHPDIRCDQDIHPLSRLGREFNTFNAKMIPVFGLDRDDDYFEAISNLPKLKESGLCIRVLEDDGDLDSPEELLEQILDVDRRIGISKLNKYVLIDLRSLIGKSIVEIQSKIFEAVKLITENCHPQKIIIAGSNYPTDVSEIGKDSIGTIPRKEIILWKDITSVFSDSNKFCFGDYGIIHPDFRQSRPAKNQNAKIRYTQPDQWVVARGHKLIDTPGEEQFRDLAKDLLDQVETTGTVPSWGEERIKQCAKGVTGLGNPQNRVAIDLNHHISVTALQLTQSKKTTVSETDTGAVTKTV